MSLEDFSRSGLRLTKGVRVAGRGIADTVAFDSGSVSDFF
jgi:hypothetical protein